MSAPLVVNTTDGTVWTRREGTRGGEALYAPEKCGQCPQFVMPTLTELAEHGIAGSADVLPVPVGPEPQVLVEEQRALVLQQLADAKPATAELVAGLAKTVRDVREHEHPKWEDLYCLNLLSYMGERMGPVLRRLLDAEARVVELEAERHSTNEALDGAVQELRERQQRDAVVAEFVAKRAEYITAIRNCHADNGHDYDRWQGHAAARRQLAELLGLPVAWPPEDGAAVAKSADKLTALLAPTQAPRETGGDPS